MGIIPARLTEDEQGAKWAQYAETRRANLAGDSDPADVNAPSTLLVPMGWQQHDTGLVVTTMWDHQVDFTYSNSGRHLWATQLSYEGPLVTPIVNFDGMNDYLNSPTQTFWEDSAAADEPSFCLAMVVEVQLTGTQHILFGKAKGTGAGGSSWVLFISSDEIFRFRVVDDATGAFIGSKSGVLPVGLHHLVVTKHDDSILSSSIITYVDGLADRADDEAATYSDMQANSLPVRIGAESDAEQSLNTHPIVGAWSGPIFKRVGTGAVWTPDQIQRDADLCEAGLGITWAT